MDISRTGHSAKDQLELSEKGFRLFLVIDPSRASLSRAMRNRTVEIFVEPTTSWYSCPADIASICSLRGIHDRRAAEFLYNVFETAVHQHNATSIGDRMSNCHMPFLHFINSTRHLMCKGESVVSATATSLKLVDLSEAAITRAMTLFDQVTGSSTSGTVSPSMCIVNNVATFTELEASNALIHAMPLPRFLANGNLDAAKSILIRYMSSISAESHWHAHFIGRLTSIARTGHILDDMKLLADNPKWMRLSAELRRSISDIYSNFTPQRALSPNEGLYIAMSDSVLGLVDYTSDKQFTRNIVLGKSLQLLRKNSFAAPIYQ